MSDVLASILARMEKNRDPPGAAAAAKATTSLAPAKDPFSVIKEDTKKKLDWFASRPELKSYEFPPMEKLSRNVVSEIAEERGLVCHAMSVAGAEERACVVWKRDSAPTSEDLERLKCERDPEYASKVEFRRKRDEAAVRLAEEQRKEAELLRSSQKSMASEPAKYLTKEKYRKAVESQDELVALNQVKRDRRTIPELEAEIARKKKKTDD